MIPMTIMLSLLFLLVLADTLKGYLSNGGHLSAYGAVCLFGFIAALPMYILFVRDFYWSVMFNGNRAIYIDGTNLVCRRPSRFCQPLTTVEELSADKNIRGGVLYIKATNGKSVPFGRLAIVQSPEEIMSSINGEIARLKSPA